MEPKYFVATCDVHISGQNRKKGDVFQADPHEGCVAAALHFKQIAESKAPKASEPPKVPEDNKGNQSPKTPEK